MYNGWEYLAALCVFEAFGRKRTDVFKLTVIVKEYRWFMGSYFDQGDFSVHLDCEC